MNRLAWLVRARVLTGVLAAVFIGAAIPVDSAPAFASSRPSASGVAFASSSDGCIVDDLEGVASPDANHVFVAGGDSCRDAVMLASSDGGANWSRQTLPTGLAVLGGIAFVSSQHGWASGGARDFTGAVITTVDGGQTWTSETLPSGVVYVFSVSFVDASHGWAAASTNFGAVVLATSDGGTTWIEQTLPTATGGTYILRDIFFRDTAYGWAVGNKILTLGGSAGVAIATVNGGTTWVEQVVPSQVEELIAVDFPTNTSGWAVGFKPSTAAIVTTANAGVTWVEQAPPAGARSLLAVSFVNDHTGWAMGNVSASGSAGPLATTNAGTVWAMQPITPSLLLAGGSFLSTTSGWTAGIVTCPDFTDVGVIYHTTNGGSSWTKQYGECPVSQAPQITGVQPRYGPDAGGNAVTISGTHFTGATAVTFGTTAASSFQVLGDGSISAVSPAGTGTVDIRVTTPGGTSPIVAADAFSYLPAVSVLPAMSNGAYGGYVTVTYVKNTGTTPVHSFIGYFDQNGQPVGTGDPLNLGVNASATVRQDNNHSFAPGGAGSAIIYSDQPLSAFVNEFAPGGTTDATSYTAIRVQSGVGTTLYAPAIANGAYGGDTTAIGPRYLGSLPPPIPGTYRH